MKNMVANKSMKKDVYAMVTERIMEEMEKGIIPWHKPWFGVAQARNYVTQRPYSPLNELLLGGEGEYLTITQCNKLGGRIKKGAKAKFVVFFKMVEKKAKGEVAEPTSEDEEKEVEMYPVLQYYNVFNVLDCEGIEPHKMEEVAKLEPIEEAENVIGLYVGRKNAPRFYAEKSGRAFYSPVMDEVHVPELSQYKEVAEYYSTAFHELVHSTGIKTRLDRGLENPRAFFGSDDYSQEELVAEMGAAMLVNKCGIDSEKAFKNSVAYLQNWLKALKNDRKLMVVAAARAEKAVNYILG